MDKTSAKMDNNRIFSDQNLQLRRKFMTILLIMMGVASIEHVATGLAERYKHLNESVINSLSKRGCDAINWQNQYRKKYTLLSNLVKETDNALSPLILLSVSANGKLALVYYFMSFILIVGRLFAVSLSAARIHNQSAIILPKIYCCPSRNRVTYRLQFQLTADEITLTGMKFFSITRKFLFTLVGTIVTYELIILEFGKIQK
ncbi:gustatory receptor for sugar taste 64f-like [Aphidius gifuensis]|uniref:gustatory receptor for sugar taste 64f-like n=1 Tax=Aphidius gifuensis TaxID=684658 RepID=UPI001CDC2C26|nr:gustatory receptor for sugar taste 64f-like [Aphidius gifuensis]